MPIQILPRDVSEKIAAGEVIQRPASVVKELLDNAIDAGATRISIQIEQAGKALIRVSDNGHGLPKEELALAFQHHATSKVSTIDDLDAISTMGFRGEALPSIAAVSEITLTSRPPEADLAACMHISFGQAGEVTDAGGPSGTALEVAHLFRNLPARLKFLKSDRTEWGRIAGVVTHAAIAFPSIAFDLTHNGQQVLSVERHADVVSRVERLFDASLAASLVSARATVRGVDVDGWISLPHVTRSNMNMVHVYVNSRYVRVPAAIHALTDAYGEYLPRGRRPVAFLFLTVPPDAVDVNVHPSKEEVRFRDAGSVHDAVRRAASGALAGIIGDDLSGPAVTPRAEHPTASPVVAERPLPYRSLPVMDGPSVTRAGYGGERRYLQIRNTYIVTEDEEGLLLVDQHALHERILLEELKRKTAERTVERQKLLVPLTVNLTPEEAARLEDIRDALDALGITVEDFGGNAVVVRSVPALLGNADPADLVLEAIHSLSPGTDRAGTLRELIGQMACRAAVKAGQELSDEEIDALLEQGRESNFSGACAHGRPTQIRISISDLEKMFERT